MRKLCCWLLLLVIVATINCNQKVNINVKNSAQAMPTISVGMGNPDVTLTSLTPRPRPILGAHFNFADQPNEVIDEMMNPAKQDTLAQALRDAGIEDLRMSFHGYYSPVGPQRSIKLKQETKLPNIFKWFPIECYISFIKKYHFTTVLGLNVEEGPQQAEQLLARFERAGALDLITAVELGNEPFLSERPWTPEDYGQQSAAIINQLRKRFKLKYGVALIIGKDHNTPTKISGDDYCDRTLQTIAPLINLRNSTDIYGVIHLYSRGVSPKAIDQFNAIVRKYSPMKYLVTEYNIRLFLEKNPHLTNEYAMEFATKLSPLLINEDVVGLWIHSFPYHSLCYWTDGKQATVVGFMDPKLTPADLTPGWHLTPAGRVQQLYQTTAWAKNILAFRENDDIQYWAAQNAQNETILSILNSKSDSLSKTVKLDDKLINVTVPARTIVSFTLNDEHKMTTLKLHY